MKIVKIFLELFISNLILSFLKSKLMVTKKHVEFIIIVFFSQIKSSKHYETSIYKHIISLYVIFEKKLLLSSFIMVTKFLNLGGSVFLVSPVSV